MEKSNNMFKWTTGVLATVVISMAGYWLTIGRDIPTRLEVSTMIEKESPYVKDEKLLRELIKRNTAAFEELTKVMGQLSIDMARIDEKLKDREDE